MFWNCLQITVYSLFTVFKPLFRTSSFTELYSNGVFPSIHWVYGILRIRHVNFDYVTPSSFNRHAMAALADVGTFKVHCIACALRQIAK
ncbi:hypothetical protein K438DRAFT_1955260 [Mycena galopus ATCC 62051]|nr:hypothetical protein K438DRAFT_1955260 [Mycena galopus ATCC 62051]